MSFGIGAFPFGIFATAFNINDGRPPPGSWVFHNNPNYVIYVLLKVFCTPN